MFLAHLELIMHKYRVTQLSTMDTAALRGWRTCPHFDAAAPAVPVRLALFLFPLSVNVTWAKQNLNSNMSHYTVV